MQGEIGPFTIEQENPQESSDGFAHTQVLRHRALELEGPTDMISLKGRYWIVADGEITRQFCVPVIRPQRSFRVNLRLNRACSNDYE